MAFTTIIMWAVSLAALSVNWRLPETTRVVTQTIVVEAPIVQMPVSSPLAAAASSTISSAAPSSAMMAPLSGYLVLAILFAVLALCFAAAHIIATEVSILLDVVNGEDLKRLQGLYLTQEAQLAERDHKIKALRVQEGEFTAALLFRHQTEMDTLTATLTGKLALMRNDAIRADFLTTAWCQLAHYYQALWRRCFSLAAVRIQRDTESIFSLVAQLALSEDEEKKLGVQVEQLQARIKQLEQNSQFFQDLTAANADLTAANTALATTNATLVAELKETEQHAATISELTAANAGLNAKLKGTEQHLAILQNKNKEATTTIARMTTARANTFTQTSLKVREQQAQITSLEGRIRSLQSQ